MSIKNKDKLEDELEKLSWEFVMESQKNNQPQDEEGFLAEADEDEELVEPIDKDDNIDEIESLYSGGDYGLNDLGRNKGIVFDEDRLEKFKLAEWHKPPRIRERSWYKFLKALGNILSWPFRALYFIVVSFVRGLYVVLEALAKMSYKTLRAVVIFPWQLLVAFKYAFIYLFGDFSWLKKQEFEPVAVNSKVKSVKLGAIRSGSVWKPVAIFMAVALILVLPLQVYISVNKSRNIKGQVLGASKLGLAHLKQAGIAGASFNFGQAGQEFELAEKQFGFAQQDVKQMGVLSNKLAVLMPDVEAGRKLLKIAQNSAQIGRHLAKVTETWKSFSDNINLDDNVQAAVGNKEIKSRLDWQGIENELELAYSQALQINKDLQDVDLEDTDLAVYQPHLEALKDNMPQLIGWLESSRDISKILLYLMGSQEPRRWMLVFQNNSELRPTGGFMGSYAIIDVKQGSITRIDVPGGGFYDLKGSLSVKVDAPYPFHLFSAIWQPWNANWFPDWPSSARKIMWFYDKSGGPTVDGVIAFTPDVVEKLLALTGEIEMPEYETKVNSHNFVRMAQIEVELEYDKQENKPKKFIADLLPVVLEKTLAMSDQHWLDLWQTIYDSLKQKHLLIYLTNNDLQSKARALGWAGEMRQHDGDYLSVIHTNVAGGKTDRVIETKIEHQAEILADGVVVDSLTLTKTHNGQPGDVFEGQVNTDYVRFYLPLGSRLLSAQGFDSIPQDRPFKVAAAGVEQDSDLSSLQTNLRIDEQSNMRITDEFGKTAMANWIQVAPGETKSVTLKYLLPFRIETAEKPDSKDYNLWDLIKKYFFGERKKFMKKADSLYSLLVQKQSGGGQIQFVSRLKVNGDWQFKRYLPQEKIELEQNSLIYTGDLTTDEYYGTILSQNSGD